MEKWSLERLPNEFVRYVYNGFEELNARLAEQPNLAQQIEDVIREQTSRTQAEALEIEYGLSILIGEEPAKAVVGCLRFLEAYEELEDLRRAGISDRIVELMRYLTARYGPVLKAVRRRSNHPLGWHKFGHSIVTLETGGKHLHLKIVRNDDSVLVVEDDTESMLRLINLMLKAMEQTDDSQSISEKTLQEFMDRYSTLIEMSTEKGVLGGERTEH